MIFINYTIALLIGMALLGHLVAFLCYFAEDEQSKVCKFFMEALPQSILQLISMVYYNETNLISILSILLSMTSIMTKTFVISQGIEWKSYLFVWLLSLLIFFIFFLLFHGYF